MKSILHSRNLVLYISFITILLNCCRDSIIRSDFEYLKNGFLSPPSDARPNVMWWWLNSNISKEGISRDLEEMKQQGIGGALIFDAAPVDRWRPKNVEPAPIGPPFMSEKWRELFRYAIEEADRLDLELGVSMTSGFNAGGPWVTPEYGQQELVWAKIEIDGSQHHSIKLPLPSGPIYGNKGQLLKYNEMEVNNDLEYDSLGQPVFYRDEAVLAIPLPLNAKIYKKEQSYDTPPGRLKNWALKSVNSFDYPEYEGFDFDVVYDDIDDIAAEPTISSGLVTDITDQLDDNGILNWTAPEGKWLILRFGHTYTGIRLQATNPQNEGLAMNHLSAEAAGRHFSEIGKPMVADIHGLNAESLKYFYLDSWEVRIANWTPGFQSAFRDRRGYDMTPFLPVLAGYIVDNREISNRFLHDYRQTIGDCIADNYYGEFSKRAHQYGLAFHAEMATTPIPVDMLKCLGRCDVPFGEFWTETDLKKGRIEPWERMFGKQAASAAHIYGSRFAAAEALTVIQKHWEHSPYQLKRTIDQALCSGLNKLMVHTFTHSPPGVRPPGYEYFAGTHFNPQITWWDQAHAFTDYISRCQYLLQQGHFVADVCYYQGDKIPNFVPKKHIYPGLGYGYDYDVVNSEVLLKRMSVKDGRLLLPDGMSYRLLILPDSQMINPEVLKRIERLIQLGATVIGPKPRKAYGLENYPHCDSIIVTMANRLWGESDDQKVRENQYGQGRIICNKTPREVLLSDEIHPDFEYTGIRADTDIDYIHRSVVNHSEKIDIYFVANFKKRWEKIECTFRIKNRIPEIWNPETGEIRDLVVYNYENGRMSCPLRLPPLGSVFVVFRKKDISLHITNVSSDSESLFPVRNRRIKKHPDLEILSAQGNDLKVMTWIPGRYQLISNNRKNFKIDVKSIPDPITIDGSWVVRFPPGWGAPDSIIIEHLKSWTEFSEPGIKYFSGTATYHKTFEIHDTLIQKNRRYYLDLEEVKDIAEITLNKQVFPIQWKPPYRVDITECLTTGKNQLQVKITNLWPNRLIGDQFLPVEQRLTFTNIGKFTRSSPLLESGLLGSVKIYIIPQMIIGLE